jgi:hypothetical protein
MAVFASAVASQNDHGYEAGRYVAQQCLAAFQRPPALLIAFMSDQYNSTEEVVRGIRSINNTIPLLGSSTPNVITMAGATQKRVALLAIGSADLCLGLALHGGIQRQSSAATEQAVAAAAEGLSAASEGAPLGVLALTTDQEGDGGPGAALHEACTRLSPQCAIVGAAGSASRTRVFVNDDVATDALALGLLRANVPMGVGIQQADAGALPDAARAAATQAMDALGDMPAAAALLLLSSAPPEADPVPEVEQVRDIVGRITPLIGAYTAGVFAPTVGGAAALQQQSVLVYVFGQGQG